MKISAVSFVHNEVHKIEECLSALRPHVDDIIIYDLESTDGTFDLCKKYTTDVYMVPYMLCGDIYKTSLVTRARGDWILWFYPDEIWPEKSLSIMRKITTLEKKWTAYSFMRREYMDDIRVGYRDERKNLIYFGSPANPNYQNRFHKMNSGIFYTELVHAELHGLYETCQMPPEYYFDHKKSSKDQEFDNVRLYIYYKYLIWKYGDTKVEPYKEYIESYRKIIRDSEKAMMEGNRRRHPAEENWWDWRKYILVKDGKIVDKVFERMEENEK